MKPTPSQKARAWNLASNLLIGVCYSQYNDLPPVLREHICTAVIPSLRRRADIIRCNAKSARGGRGGGR